MAREPFCFEYTFVIVLDPPRGATLLSIRAACCMLPGAARSDYGAQAASVGLCAARFAHDYFHSEVSAFDLARYHSAAPMLLAMSPPDYAQWIKDSIGNGSVEIWHTRVFPEAPRFSDLTRRCPMCVRHDIENVGFAYARVLHQSPALQHCPVHHIPLHEKCLNCGAPFHVSSAVQTLRWRIDRCELCGGAEGVPLTVDDSRGYRDRASLLERLQQGTATIRPAQRLRALDTARTVADSGAGLEAAFNRYWSAESFESACMKAGTVPSKMHAMFLGSILPHTFHEIVTADAFSSAVLENACVEVTTIDEATRYEYHGLAARLVPWVVNYGLAAEVAALLAEGFSTYALERRGHSYSQLQLLGARLPADLASLLRAVQRDRRVANGVPLVAERPFISQWRLDRNRRRATQLIVPGMSRDQIFDSDRTLFDWLKRFDLDWLESQLPPAKRRRGATKETNRTMVLFCAICAEEDQRQSHVKTKGFLRWWIRREEPNLYAWMMAHDSAWFNYWVAGAISRAPRSLPESRRQLHAAIAQGVTSRAGLEHSFRPLHRWLVENDPEALLAAFGPAKARRPSTLAEAEHRLVQAIEAGATTEAKLNQTHVSLYRWIVKNALELLKLLPPTLTLEDRRGQVLAFVKDRSESQTSDSEMRNIRRQLYEDEGALYAWMMKNDVVWLNKQCPGGDKRLPNTREEALIRLRQARAKGARNRSDLWKLDHKLFRWIAANEPGLLVQNFGLWRRPFRRHLQPA